jgi:hypothetical protein
MARSIPTFIPSLALLIAFASPVVPAGSVPIKTEPDLMSQPEG